MLVAALVTAYQDVFQRLAAQAPVLMLDTVIGMNISTG